MEHRLLDPLTPRRESEIQRAILAHCNRLPGVVLWRANSGAVTAAYKGKTRFVRFTTMPGMSDLVGFRRTVVVEETGAGNLHTVAWARFLAIEVKRPGGTLTTAQAGFLDMVRTAGGLAFVATCVEDCVKAGL